MLRKNCPTTPLSEMLFNEKGNTLERFINEVNSEDRNAISQFIHDFISWLKARLKGEKVSLKIVKLENRFAAVLRNVDTNAQKNNTTNDGDVQYEIKENSKGKYVQAKVQVIHSSNPKIQEREIIDYVNNVVREGHDLTITFDNEESIVITGRTAWKLGDKGNYSDEIYLVKGNASGVIDEIIQTSQYKQSKPSFKEHRNGFAENGFNYRSAYFRDLDGKYYKLRLSVGLNSDGKEAYNIGKIEEIPFPDKSVSGSKANGMISLNNKISQKDNVVNTHYTQEIENNSSPEQNNDGNSYSFGDNERYAEYDKPITPGDIRLLREIGRKSINEFTPEEIEIAQKWAYKFYQQLGTKSPFFRRWFGDWRAYERSNFIDVLLMENRDGKNPRGAYTNNDTGWVINSSSVGYDETISHSGKDKKSIIAMKNIDKIIENAVLLDTEISEYGRGKKSVYTAFMHKFYAPVRIDGKIYLVKMAVDESHAPGQNDTNKKFYHVRAIEIETASSVGIGESHTPIIENTVSNISISNLFNLVKTYDTKFKPNPVNAALINEADGTPKVFYHGTNAQFTEFDKKKSKPGFYGRGFYFTTEKSQANVYGNEMPVYLNIKNPLMPGKTTVTETQISNFLEAVAENEDYSIENYGTYNVAEIMRSIESRDAFDVVQDINATAIGDFGEAIQLFNKVNGTSFDGVITSTETVVYERNQIKSADGGNIGTFSETENDIRYSFEDDVVDKTSSLAERVRLGEISQTEYLNELQSLMNDATEKYGAIPKGENPKVDVTVPKQVSDKRNTRRFVRTVLESGALT